MLLENVFSYLLHSCWPAFEIKILFLGGVVIFQDNRLEFLSYFLLKKCSKKSKHFEGNVILTKSDPKATHSLLTKVKLLWHFYAVASLYSLRNVLKKFIISNDNSNLESFQFVISHKNFIFMDFYF